MPEFAIYLKWQGESVDLPYTLDQVAGGKFEDLDPQKGLNWLHNRKALATRQRLQAALDCEDATPEEKRVYSDLLELMKNRPIHVWRVTGDLEEWIGSPLWKRHHAE